MPLLRQPEQPSKSFLQFGLLMDSTVRQVVGSGVARMGLALTSMEALALLTDTKIPNLIAYQVMYQW